MTTSTTSDKPAAKDVPPAAPAAAPAAAPSTAPSDVVTLTINGVRVTAKKGMLLIEAAKLAGVDIPVFCYHDRLKPVGACRMCLVEIEKMPRLQTACTTPVGQDMVVKTQSDNANSGQRSVLSLLLANHPLDCPVCDKGGECPLQDNAFGHGPGVSTFKEEKRHADKAFELSEQILLDRERCILCYRCVRFHEEIPGDRALGVVDRGGHGVIGVPAGERYDSPFSGNVIDLCPVGALTSRQYRFRSRPWELTTTPSIACDDAVGAHVDVDTRDGRVLRVRPRVDFQRNDAWLADHTRFGTVPQDRGERLATPLVRDAAGALKPAGWPSALARAASLLRGQPTAVLVHPNVTNEAMGVVADLRLGPLCVLPRLSAWPARGTLFSVARSKTVVVVGVDPWRELPLLALWIRRAVAPSASSMGVPAGFPLAAGQAGANLIVLHDDNGLARDTLHWIKAGKGELRARLAELVEGLEGHGPLAAVAAALDDAPATLLVGSALSHDPEARPLLDKLAAGIGATGDGGLVGAPDPYANARGAVELFGAAAADDPMGKGGVVQRAAYGDLERALLVGAVDVKDLGKARGVWLTHSLPAEAPEVPAFVDVVLPLAHPYEQSGSFTNLEGTPQHFDAAGMPPGRGDASARADWAALAALADELGGGVPRELVALRDHLGRTQPLLARVPRPKKGLAVLA
ncbi:MAG: (2Fe-2S)-binding protein [Deltaproteobacteria bacterium]|nr:(2Fe-2S)-binding protein [Deltaproteobacteria bacterium]